MREALKNLWLLPRWGWGFPGGAVVKNPPANAGGTRDEGFNPWVGKIPWTRKWQPTLVLLPGESHGQWILAVYSPWGHKRVRHNLVTKQRYSLFKLSFPWHMTHVRGILRDGGKVSFKDLIILSIQSLEKTFFWVIFFHFLCGPSLKPLLNLLWYSFCFTFWFFDHEACGISASRLGIKCAHPALQGRVLTTGPSGKSLDKTFNCGGSELRHT